MMKNYKYIFKILLIGLIILAQSCSEDFLNEFPTDAQAPGDIKKISDVEIVMNGVYDLMQNNNFFGQRYITMNDIRSDDNQVPDFGRLEDEYKYDYDVSNASTGLWSQPYTIIRQANSIIELLESMDTDSDSDEASKQDMIGQSLAIRALAHFTLCNWYGYPYSHDGGTSLGVPIVTTVALPEVLWLRFIPR